ncbi:hypothetical protein [Flavobacterium sharifuzzamanii]|uniref:hypothetical protein n=1 Tax=Flavobacterium sharifuzzamanii TaxID=2211133 RepID=UPI000DAC4A1A|nr:hypothetical protein [Flavobacterium sharifuzzamanii]KAF2080213.1 hypothetical protein DMA14_12985 [Flavobacterium sharifuzzamanii]
MERIKSISIKYHIPTIIGVMFLLFSCTKDEILNNGLEMNNTSFTDEEVFKGVMFLEGPVANKMNDFKDLNFRSFVADKSQIEEIINFQNEVVNRIKSIDPNYLSDFRKKIGSGDYYLIKETFSKASTKISNIIYEISNLDKNEISIVAKKFNSNLKYKYNIDEKSSKEDLIKALNDIKSEKQTSKNVMPDYYYKWAAVWIAAAAVLIIVIVAQEAPLEPIDEFEPFEPFPDEANSQLSSEKRYLMDDYQSEITFELQGI